MANKQHCLVSLGNHSPNRSTISAVNSTSRDAVVWYWCPVHGRAPQIGDRIWVAQVSHRPTCCAHA
jgi:hypothetical protein